MTEYEWYVLWFCGSVAGWAIVMWVGRRMDKQGIARYRARARASRKAR